MLIGKGETNRYMKEKKRIFETVLQYKDSDKVAIIENEKQITYRQLIEKAIMLSKK